MRHPNRYKGKNCVMSKMCIGVIRICKAASIFTGTKHKKIRRYSAKGWKEKR